MQTSYQAVLLIAFGGPRCSAEIRPFLARVLKGIPIPPRRLEEVVRHYEAVGGRSPLGDITRRQARALQAMLRDSGFPLSVYVGLRNSSPFFVETLKQMRQDGIEKALGFILSAQQNEASWQRYQGNIADARAALGQEAPEIDYCPEWHAHPLFIQTWVEEIRRTFAGSHNQGDETALLFTAHSLPIPMAQQSPYVDQLQTQTRMIAERLGCQRWSIAYQSRSGKPSDPWLEPDVYQGIRNFAAQGMRRLIVAPIGFVCDHVEVLYDLDIDARKFAEQLGLRFYRAHCPNDRPTFIQMMAEVVKGQLAGD